MHLFLALVLAALPAASMADVKAGEKKAQLCVLCHKPQSSVSAVPLLDGQPVAYLVTATTAYKTGARSDAVMNTNAANLSAKDIRDIAEFFASRTPPAREQKLDPVKIEAGEKRVGKLQCTSCHQASFRGEGNVPWLAGQTYHYLLSQLRSMVAGQRPHPATQMPEQADVDAVASYLASLR